MPPFPKPPLPGIARSVPAGPQPSRVTAPPPRVVQRMDVPQTHELFQKGKAGTLLKEAVPPTGGSGKWAIGYLYYYDGEGEELQKATFGARSGQNTTYKQDGYKDRRKSLGNASTHHCGEAHVLNWADEQLKNAKKGKPSRLILLAEAQLCAACTIDRQQFSRDHPLTYVQTRAAGLYGTSRIEGMAAPTEGTEASWPKQKGKTTLYSYNPLVRGQALTQQEKGAKKAAFVAGLTTATPNQKGKGKKDKW